MISSLLVYTLLSLATTTTASPLEQPIADHQSTDVPRSLLPRQSVTDLEQKIASIQTAVAEANETVVSFQSGGLDGITSLLNVNDAVVKLGTVIKEGTDAAAATPQLNVADSTAVGIQFLGLQPNINLLLNNLISKRQDIDGAAFGLLDVRGLIHDSLITQQDGAKGLADALIKDLDPSLLGIATPINDQIQGNFTAAVKQFDGRSGVVKIPTKLVPTASKLLAKLGPALEGILGIGGGLNKGASVDTPSKRAETKYCCGITQEELDKMSPDENDTSKLPIPVALVLKTAGII